MQRAAFVLASALVALLPLTPAHAQADSTDGERGVGTSTTRRLVDSGPRGEAPVVVGLASGYGYTESVLGAGDGHHRLSGVFLIEGAPTEWLGVGLRLDGRYDRHAFADRPSDDGWVGEPRLYARADRRVSAAVSLGMRATLMLPGAKAPSVQPGAASGELLALASHSHGALRITGNAGYRLDRSAHSAEDAHMLAPGDRLALGVSDFDAALLGAGAEVTLGRWQLHGEWSWEALLGKGAPGAATWPMRLGAGARTNLLRDLTAELIVEGSPSARPSMDANAPLVPVGPRLGVMAGLTWAVGVPGKATRQAAPPLDPPPPPRLLPVPELTVSVEADGTLPADARVLLRRPGEERSLSSQGGAAGVAGRFRATDLSPGSARLTVEAAGYEPFEMPVELVPGQPASLTIAVRRKLPSGQIRGTVRSFNGRPLAAQVRVVPSAGGAEALPSLRSTGGRFQLDVPPGRYQVTIAAPAHRAQARTVDVEQNGVTVLNADLRRAR